ncbi:ABC-type transporter, periplasmic subunit [Rhizobium sp. CF080]|uniref:ABC transporter substrate-binding protein n=1 Tax=Rhizobium sp. (strain CF080) TaxID=1144310 RepID=UPI0002718A66|nr:ABC transporter substrate-binding protein [Rhizobium sp. CF080]EUB99432.1 ABC-type transporter, periplasmic subunit [Rhizobium sp. CF080]
MQVTRRSAMTLLGAGAAYGLLGAPTICFAQAAGSSTLRVALDELPKQLDPLLYQTNPGYRTMLNIYDTLLTVNYAGDGALKPALAESWKRIDAQTIELVLRQGVLFHDGSPLTVDDVVFSFSFGRMFDPKSPGYGVAQQFLSTIKSVDAVDAKTVRVTSKVADPALELRLTAWGSQIVSKKAFEAAGGFAGFARKPVGTGPFSVGSLSPDAVKLKAFAQYWGGKPNIEALTYSSSPELSSRIAGLASNDFDIITDVPADQFDAVTRDSSLEIVGGTVASLRIIKFDTRNEVLKDVRVRKALGLAVDRQAIVDALWQGKVDVPHGHQLPAYGPFFDASRPAYKYDPTEAKKLLDAAGYKGQPIPYRIRTAAYGPELATAQIVVSMWEQIGVKIDLQIVENFAQMMAYPGVGMRNGVDPVLVNDPLFGLWRSYDRSQKDVWTNEEFFTLGDKLQSSIDLGERKQAFAKMMDIFDADPPGIILHTMGVFYGKKKSIKWKPIPSVYMDFRGASLA